MTSIPGNSIETVMGSSREETRKAQVLLEGYEKTRESLTGHGREGDTEEKETGGRRNKYH